MNQDTKILVEVIQDCAEYKGIKLSEEVAIEIAEGVVNHYENKDTGAPDRGTAHQLQKDFDQYKQRKEQEHRELMAKLNDSLNRALGTYGDSEQFFNVKGEIERRNRR